MDERFLPPSPNHHPELTDKMGMEVLSGTFKSGQDITYLYLLVDQICVVSTFKISMFYVLCSLIEHCNEIQKVAHNLIMSVWLV
jgi:hypothetical protein